MKMKFLDFIINICNNIGEDIKKGVTKWHIL